MSNRDGNLRRFGRRFGWSRCVRPACVFAASLILNAAPARADIGDLVDRAIDRATQARDRATDAKNAANDIRERIAAGASMLTGAVRERIQDAVAQVRDRIELERAGMAEFTPDRVAAFRDQLLRFLTELQSLEDRVNAIGGDCGLGAPLHGRALQAMITLVENAPAGVLYPLFAANIDFCGVEDLHMTIDALQIVQDAMASDDADDGADDAPSDESDPFAIDREQFDARLSASRVYIERRKVLGRAGSEIKHTAWALKKIAGLLETQGEAGTEATVGIHGYALVTVKFNKVKEMGIMLKGISGALESIQKDLSDKMKGAESLSTANLILVNQEAILRNQESLLNGR